jgi:hypothetical protein
MFKTILEFFKSNNDKQTSNNIDIVIEAPEKKSLPVAKKTSKKKSSKKSSKTK